MNKKLEEIIVFIITTFPIMWLTMEEVRELFSPELVSTITPIMGVAYYLNQKWQARRGG